MLGGIFRVKMSHAKTNSLFKNAQIKNMQVSNGTRLALASERGEHLMKKLISALIILLGINAQAQQVGLEPILGFLPRPEAVYFQVHSGGCTLKSDFKVSVENIGDRKSVRLFRINPDECLAFFPTGATLKFSHEELGLKSGDHFMISNPIAESIVW